jgi:hypothetical protein
MIGIVEPDISRVESLEGQVKSLGRDELKVFRDWFADFDSELWDAQIEDDSKSAKLRALMERALRDHEAGRSSLL